MTDDALIAWLNAGAPVPLQPEDAAAKRAQTFARRFVEALTPVGEIGITEEEVEAGIAQDVYAVHKELNALGEIEYSAAWSLLPANQRSAIKHYVSMASAAR